MYVYRPHLLPTVLLCYGIYSLLTVIYTLLCYGIASYPDLLTPAFVTCSTNVKEHTCTWTLGGRVEEWHIHSVQLWGGFLNPRNVAKTAWCQPLSPAGSVVVIGSSPTYWECATPPHVHPTSLHANSFTRPSPVLVLQATNTGVRGPWVQGYYSHSLLTVMYI